MTTTGERTATRHRAHRRSDPADRADGFATAVASILTVAGAVLMAVGFAGSIGLLDVSALDTGPLIGLGLVGLGSGVLILVLLQVWRIHTTR
jgi:hypothetical protein